MRTIISIAAFGAMIITLSSCSNKSDKWEKYVSNDGNYSITMPSEAAKADKPEVTIFGKQTVHYLTWKPSLFGLDKFKLFQVSYIECPKEAIASDGMISATLDHSINERKKSDFNEIEVETQNIQINGYPARAFIYAVPGDNVVTIVKECIAGNKLYDIVVTAKRNYPTNAELTVFFNSFQILRQ